jgi:uncharacterized protein (TIGR02246 family)
MKRFSIVALVAGIAAPALAQQGASDPQAMQIAQQLGIRWEQAYNASDAKKIASFFAPDGVMIAATGAPPIIGAQAIEKALAERFKQTGPGITQKITYQGAKMLAPDLIAAYGEAEFTGGKQPIRGRFGDVLKQIGGEWKKELLVSTPIPNEAPAPSVGSTTSPAK